MLAYIHVYVVPKCLVVQTLTDHLKVKEKRQHKHTDERQINGLPADIQ